jgi:putative tryptophan/tyrosine transport system substrate-binding protein
VKAAALAASALGIDVRLLNASNEREIDDAFASLSGLRVGGLVVPNEPFLDSQRERITEHAARYSVPTLYNLREYVTSGGLVSYGPSLPDSYRRAATYAGLILKGQNRRICRCRSRRNSNWCSI